jgi:hypothetical protein
MHKLSTETPEFKALMPLSTRSFNMLRIFYMQATGYASGHEYIDYGEVVPVLDEWEDRLVEALSTSYDSNSFDPGPPAGG